MFRWGGTNWTSVPLSFNLASEEVLLAGVTNFSAFVLSQIIPPQLTIQNQTNRYVFHFTPVPNCAHVLERSTDLVNWTSLTTNTPANSQPAALQDNTPPGGSAFYRLRLNTP